MRIPSNFRVLFLKQAIKNGLNLLAYDIETSHMLVRTFYIGQKVSIHHNQIVRPSQVISIQYMWAEDKKAQYLEWDKVNKEFDDSSMIEEFTTNVLSIADITLTQNGDKFDFVTLNERAKSLHLTILAQQPSIDILKLSRKSFKSASHKLDYRSHQQGLGGKIQMVDQDWVDVEENGVPVSKKMGPYGCKDTEDTLKLFWKELPYYKDLPVAVEKVILKFLPKEFLQKHLGHLHSIIKCPDCKAKHRCCTNIKVTKKDVTCLNCKQKLKI